MPPQMLRRWRAGVELLMHELARESGFKGVVDLLKIAKHGPGENVYLVRFHYVAARNSSASGKGRTKGRQP